MSDTAKRIEQLSPKQRELLRRRLEQKNAGTAAPAPVASIPRLERDRTSYPLSFSQLRQWILEELEPGTAAYNLPAPMRLAGDLDTAALERSFTEIVRRQEGLRTTFTAGDATAGGGEPMQVIHPPAPLSLPVVDLGALSESDGETEEHRLAAADAERPFDL
ncbi:MAG: condensation protein, partial [Acidobacteria bacterium]|nr:condensation protein [Acidobacteriota bacterium]